jgi:hypothetical protein
MQWNECSPIVYKTWVKPLFWKWPTNEPENTAGTRRWLHNTRVSSLFAFMQSIIILTLGYSCTNGSVLRTNLSLSRTHKLALPAPLYTKFTVSGMRGRKFWYEMEEAGFFNALVPDSRNYTRCSVPVLVPTALSYLIITCIKYLLTLRVHYYWISLPPLKYTLTIPERLARALYLIVFGFNTEASIIEGIMSVFGFGTCSCNVDLLFICSVSIHLYCSLTRISTKIL